MASQVVITMLFVLLILLNSISIAIALSLAPALYVFGDSLMDSGNNNFLPTLARANYLPYGVDFPKGPTGRFTNGKTVADFIAEYLGLPYSPPYIGFKGSKSLTGINYASGSCGILPKSGAKLGKCLNLRQQINLFQRTIKMDLPKKIKNSTQLSEHLSKSIYICSIGSNDYINNYLQTDTSKRDLPQSFAKLLIDNLSEQFQKLYKLGARKIIMFEIGPVGCIPSVTRKHSHTGDCVEETNNIVAFFNNMISPMLKNLTSTLSGFTSVLGRINSLSYDAVKNPSIYGLTDASNPCCSTWGNGTSGCIPLSKPCINPNNHIFWDAFHLTEAMYSLLASGCATNTSICTPFTIQHLVKI